MDAIAPASAVHRLVPVLDNIPIARDTYRLRLGDATMARAIKPGQFVMIRPGPEGATDPLLGRPLALYEVVRDPARRVRPRSMSSTWWWDAERPPFRSAGRASGLPCGARSATALARPPPDRSSWWPAASVRRRSWHWAAGGSARPIMATSQRGTGKMPVHVPGHRAGSQPGSLSSAITLLYGVRTAALLAGVDDFRRAGIEVELATDDGTAGHHGYVTDILARRLERGDRPARVVGCGPPAMLATLAKIAHQYDVPCDVSLENHMACGFGACFSCVAPIRQADGSTDLRRVCVEGPVVSADLVDWPRLVH